MTEIEDELFSDNQTDYSFSELIEELERTGEILRQWESGAPIDNAPQQNKTQKLKKNYDEKRETIQ